MGEKEGGMEAFLVLVLEILVSSKERKGGEAGREEGKKEKTVCLPGRWVRAGI